MQSSAKAAKRIERKQHALPVSIPPLFCAFVRQNRQLHAPQARRRLKVPTEIGSVSSLRKDVIEPCPTNGRKPSSKTERRSLQKRFRHDVRRICQTLYRRMTECGVSLARQLYKDVAFKRLDELRRRLHTIACMEKCKDTGKDTYKARTFYTPPLRNCHNK